MLSIAGAQTPIDFLMYIGDEIENEEAFMYLNELNNEQGKKTKFVDSNALIHPCAIGMRDTHANYYLDSADDASTLFEQLAIAIRRKRDNTRRIKSQIDFMPLFHLPKERESRINATHESNPSVGSSQSSQKLLRFPNTNAQPIHITVENAHFSPLRLNESPIN